MAHLYCTTKIINHSLAIAYPSIFSNQHNKMIAIANLYCKTKIINRSVSPTSNVKPR
jgi:N-dimethylarginine dimethylaminohydrolase